MSSHIGPGVANSSFTQPPRDPDPTRDPNKQQTTSPWVPENEAAQPGTRRYEIERGLATIAAVLAGGLPMLTWYGTFDENRLAPKRARPAAKRAPKSDGPRSRSAPKSDEADRLPAPESDEARPDHVPAPPTQRGYDFDAQ